MGFLQRSKSAAVTEHRSKEYVQCAATPTGKPMPGREEKTSTSHEQQNYADRPTSFSRPRTANAALGRSTDIPPPPFRIDFKAGDEVFSFPTPSPRLPPQRNTTKVLAPSALHESEAAVIGVAIGSPHQAPQAPWDDSFVRDHRASLVPAPLCVNRRPQLIPEHPDLEMPLNDVKRKKATWKTLGGLFNRKTAKTASDELAIQEKEAIQHRPETAHSGGPKPSLPGHQRKPSITRGQARFEARAEADKAAFMPANKPTILRSPSMIQKEGLSPMFRSIQGIPEETAWVDDLRKDSPLSIMAMRSVKEDADVEPIAVPGTPTLVLDLPDPRFDRYSVMFEKVLEDSKSSLLARRQSKLRRNTSVKKLDIPALKNDQPEVPRLEVNGVPERSATSPGLAKSLSVRIGKKMLSPVSEAFSALNRPRPVVRRSKTMPKLATSPRAGIFSSPRIGARSASPGSAGLTDCSSPFTPMTATTFSESGSPGIMVSNASLAPRGSGEAEPNWDMMTSQAIEDYKASHLMVKAQPKLGKHTVQVSVAKQIHVSNNIMQIHKALDQKPLLRPKVVKLSKDLKSTFVVIESTEE